MKLRDVPLLAEVTFDPDCNGYKRQKLSEVWTYNYRGELRDVITLCDEADYIYYASPDSEVYVLEDKPKYKLYEQLTLF